MPFEMISIDQVQVKPFVHWDKEWFLLTCGDFSQHKYNTMTVAWGSMGTMWNKPFIQVVVRPTRYTYDFMEAHNHFTLSAFPSAYKKQLAYLGSVSGRDEDKIAKAGLTGIASIKIASPGFEEADLIFECRKIYADDFNPSHFLDASIEDNYPLKDYHSFYFGEVLCIRKKVKA